MTMKWQAWLIGAVFAVTVPAGVRAQQAGSTDNNPPAQAPQEASNPAPARAGNARHSGMNRLNLTPDQRTQMKSIRQDRWKQVEAVKNDSSTNDEQKYEKLREIRQASRKQMRALLTPEQRATWREMAMERRRARAQRQAPGENPAPSPSPAPTNPSTPE